MKSIIGKLVLPALALAMLSFGLFHMLRAQQVLPKPPPPAQPARSPFGATIAGAGVVEARSENIAIGAALPGLVLEVFVPVDDVGKQVQAGDKLFRVDDRQLLAQLAVQQANLAAAKAQLTKLEEMPRPEEIPAAEARVKAAVANAARLLDQYQRSEKLLASRSIAVEERNILQRQYEEAVHQREQAAAELQLLTAGAWEPDKAIARAAIHQTEAQIVQTETEIERALVRAPVSGRVLQVNVRPGEFVGAAPGAALVVLGDIGSLRVRVDIDEAEIPRVRPGMNARAFPRGGPRQEVPLRFVRVEPLVIPKRSLTGDNTERVDTRVLKVLYEVVGADRTLYVGQQLDVFLDAGDASSPATDVVLNETRGRPCVRPRPGETHNSMRFAKWVFLLAGISGVIMLLPLYFLEQKLGRDHPPAVNHPELYYGFVGVTLAWQLMFLVIASDPARFRLAMLPALVEKASFAIAIPILYAQGRVAATLVALAAMDATWFLLFLIAFLRSGPETEKSTVPSG